MQSRVTMRPARRRMIAALAALPTLAVVPAAHAIENLKVYFDKTTSTNGSAIGGFTYNPADDSFWVSSFVVAGAQIRNLKWNGSAYVPSGTGSGAANGGHVSEASWFLYKRSDETQTTATPDVNSGWSGGQMTVGNLILNPKPITINGVTHAAGTLMLINDSSNNVVEQPGAISHPEFNKHVYWYNLTETFTPTPAGPGIAPGASTDYNGNGTVEWNDQFLTVVTHADLNVADGRAPTDTAAQNWARSFAFSTDGQSAYMVDSANNYGGIYRVNLTAAGAITKVLSAEGSGNTINTEPGVVHTSVRNFGFAGTGDQVVVEGSTGLGNAGGINAYLDDGVTFNTTPVPVIAAADFLAFTERSGTARFSSITFDAAGNMYFSESGLSDAAYMLDTAGRLVKIANAAERAAFRVQAAGPDAYNASILDLQTRTNTALGFALTEVLYSDASFDAPVGILVPKVGDFNLDNSVTTADKSAFLAALATRGTSTTNPDLYVFDLNGSATGSSTAHSAVVDWKDVKVLQTFLGFEDGDTNLDMSVDYTDLDTMGLNYYTLAGAADKTWGLGDIASIDPLYAPGATDANLVNEVDLMRLAVNWDLAKPTFADLDRQGYTGQFRDDVIRIFDIQQTAPAVPEPATLALAGLGGLMLVRRRELNR